MTTENGIDRIKTMRHHIETLRRRREYVLGQIEEKWPDGEPGYTYERAEVNAIEWALPVLEAEFDAMARRRHAMDEQYQYLSRMEASGGTPKSSRFEWPQDMDDAQELDAIDR